jgi:hypothetical protein
MAEPASWELGEEEARQLLALSAADRAAGFFQLVADWEEAWGLVDATNALPLWPHTHLAAACARGPWSGTTPQPIPLDELTGDLLPQLADDGLRVAVFPSPDDPGLLVSAQEFEERLEQELQIGGW